MQYILNLRNKMQILWPKEILFIAGMGLVIALLSIPLLQNLSIFTLLSEHGVTFLVALMSLFLIMPIGLLVGATIAFALPLSVQNSTELARYGVVGVLNVVLNASIYNLLIIFTGLTHGLAVPFFSAIAFVIVVTQSFFWNMLWTFKHIDSADRKMQYVRFFSVSGLVAIVNIGIIQIFVNVIGAPIGIPEAVWANIALLVTIITAVLGNFFGYKYFVFAS